MFEVRKSAIEGSGIFAMVDFKKGEAICEFEGQRLTIPQLKEKYESGVERIDDPFQIGYDIYLDLEKPYVFFNHSCEPNTVIRGSGSMYAFKDIKVGEEITYDYSTTEWTDDEAWGINWHEIWKIPCVCGSVQCRKEVRVFPLLPSVIQEKYYQANALMDFIRTKLETRRFDIAETI
jgi:uncharacterized protein